MIFFGFLFIISFIVKLLLHVYLANKNDNPIAFSGAGDSIELFWFYTKPVADEYKNLKKICNYLHAYNLIMITIGLICGILNSINK